MEEQLEYWWETKLMDCILLLFQLLGDQICMHAQICSDPFADKMYKVAPPVFP